MIGLHKDLRPFTRVASKPATAHNTAEGIAMKITDLIIDPKSLGNELWLVEMSPAYEYQNNRRTDTVLVYRCTVVLPEKCPEKVMY